MTDIDINAIEAITSLQRPGKPNLLAKIIALFEQNSPALIEAIEAGVANQDLESIQTASHTLKSSAAYLGATELEDKCKKLEKFARENNFEGCQSTAEGLSECYQGSIDALQPYFDKAA